MLLFFVPLLSCGNFHSSSLLNDIMVYFTESILLLQLVRRQHHAAITIQAHYRGHVHRQNLVGLCAVGVPDSDMKELLIFSVLQPASRV